MFFTRRGVGLVAAKRGRGLNLRLRFVGADAGVKLESGARDWGTVSYLVGDRSHWRRALPTHRTLIYRGLWPGINLVLSGRGGILKYEFQVSRGADVRAIRLAYAGARRLALGPEGSLLVHTALGTLRDLLPVSYQRSGGARVVVESHHALHGSPGSYGFTLGAGYNPHRPLVIDPGIVYSTFLGGTDADEGMGVAVDAHGSAYVAGRTLSADYPSTAGAFDADRHGPSGSDAFVTKFDPSGAVAYSTFMGGADTDEGLGIAVDEHGSAYLTGQTWSADFPTTAGAADPSFNGVTDAFDSSFNGRRDAVLTKIVTGEVDEDEGAHAHEHQTEGDHRSGRSRRAKPHSP